MKQLSWFSLVGLAALALHWSLVVALVPLGLTPLWANPLAFLIAFQVSYFGHRHLTFAASTAGHMQTLPRFFVVACVSFLLNQLLYALLLYCTPLDYRLSLLLVLSAVASLTFISSRTWAFR